MKPDYIHVDCFGNGKRYWVSREDGAKKLEFVYKNGFDTIPGKEYVENRKWKITVDQLEKALLEAIKEE